MVRGACAASADRAELAVLHATTRAIAPASQPRILEPTMAPMIRQAATGFGRPGSGIMMIRVSYRPSRGSLNNNDTVSAGESMAMMMSQARWPRLTLLSAVLLAAAAAASAQTAPNAQPKTPPPAATNSQPKFDTFTATTANLASGSGE